MFTKKFMNNRFAFLLFIVVASTVVADCSCKHVCTNPAPSVKFINFTEGAGFVQTCLQLQSATTVLATTMNNKKANRLFINFFVNILIKMIITKFYSKRRSVFIFPHVYRPAY